MHLVLAPRLRSRSQYVIISGPQPEIPVELKDDAIVVHVPLPDETELSALFDEVTAKLDRSLLPAESVKARLGPSAWRASRPDGRARVSSPDTDGSASEAWLIEAEARPMPRRSRCVGSPEVVAFPT